MAQLFATHVQPGFGRTMYDVGSFDVNGNYRSIVEAAQWRYVGLDISEGPNVDVVIPEKDSWLEHVGDERADLVISGQCME
ncbi:MAG: methyltransferase type 11, partial [Hyphomicrobiaceae bacterium]